MVKTKVLFFIVLIFASSLGYQFAEFEEDSNTTSTTGDLTTGSTGTESTTGSTTGGSTGNTTDSTTTSSTTGSDSLTCSERLSCGDCTTDDKCLWCESSSECIPGNWWGPQNTSDCGTSWRYKECKADMKYVFLGIAGGAAFVILVCVIILCKCMCCQSGRKNKFTPRDFKEFKSLRLKEEETEELISRHPKTDSRRAELMKKYGSKLNSTNV